MCCHAQLFVWVLGIRCRSLCLQALYGAIEPSPQPLLTGVVSGVSSVCTPDTESSPGPTLGPQLFLLIHGQTHLSPRIICSCSFNHGSNSGPLCPFPTCSPVAPFLLLCCPHVSSTLLPPPLPILEWALLSFQVPGLGIAHPQPPPSHLMSSPPSPCPLCFQHGPCQGSSKPATHSDLNSCF